MVFNEIAALIATNDENRRSDTTDDLIDISEIMIDKTPKKFPLFVPKKWQCFKPITQSEYRSKFILHFPNAYDLLIKHTNIVVAGGAAAKPLYTINTPSSDIDIFIYGLKGEDFWNKVNDIAKEIVNLSVNLSDQSVSITQKIKKGLISIGVFNEIEEHFQEYQIILREYETVSSIIHGFDIPSCCVAYDGKKAYTTSLGAYSHSTQINIIIPKYRSLSYEHRLIKYFNRNFGFGLINFPDFNIKEPSWTLRYITLTRISRINNYICGIVSINRHSNTLLCESEYSEIPSYIKKYDKLLFNIQNIENTGITLIMYSTNDTTIDYSKFYKYSVNDIIHKYYTNIKNIISKHINYLCSMDLNKLIETDLPKSKLILIIMSIINKDMYGAERVLIDQINANSDYVPNWIIEQSIDSAYSSAVNPMAETYNEWYNI